jgi:hypothetical protein
MRIAVLYTGEVRTIETTSPFFKKYVIDPTNADIFATIQGDISIDTLNHLLTNYWKDNMKSLTKFQREQYDQLQDTLLDDMDLSSNHWRDYLKYSGSMVEYYQLYLSFQEMKKYELQHGFQYDYIIRLRTDVVVTKPLDFSWFSREITLQTPFLDSIPHFFQSFFSREHLLVNEFIDIHANVNDKRLQEISDISNHLNIDDLTNYRKNGNYLLTIRKNVFFVGRRNVFEIISNLGITYGKLRLYKYEHWFDAESQLETICEYNEISIFDGTTRLEGESLYQYKKSNYFDDCGALLNLPSVFCFICRN